MEAVNSAHAFVFVGTSMSVGVTKTVLQHATLKNVPVFNYGTDTISKLLRIEEGRGSPIGIKSDRLTACDVIGDCVKTLPALMMKVKTALQ